MIFFFKIEKCLAMNHKKGKIKFSKRKNRPVWEWFPSLKPIPRGPNGMEGIGGQFGVEVSIHTSSLYHPMIFKDFRLL